MSKEMSKETYNYPPETIIARKRLSPGNDYCPETIIPRKRLANGTNLRPETLSPELFQRISGEEA